MNSARNFSVLTMQDRSFAGQTVNRHNRNTLSLSQNLKALIVAVAKPGVGTKALIRSVISEQLKIVKKGMNMLGKEHRNIVHQAVVESYQKMKSYCRIEITGKNDVYGDNDILVVTIFNLKISSVVITGENL